MASFVVFTFLAIVVSLSNAAIIFNALQEPLVPNGDGSYVRMANGDDGVIDMTGDLHEVADIKLLVDKPGLPDMIQDSWQWWSCSFSVELTNTIPELKHPTTVDFDHITTNDGDGYYPRTRIFTAPKADYYLFSASLISYHRSRFFIMMNGQRVVYLATNGGWTADAATVYLKLAKGDKVWIEGIGEINGSSPNCSYTRLFGNRHNCYHSSFSGFLIKEI